MLPPPPTHTHTHRHTTPIEPILTDKPTTKDKSLCHYIPSDQLKDVGCSSLGLGMKAVLERAIRGSGQEVSAASGPAAGSQQPSRPGVKKAALCMLRSP